MQLELLDDSTRHRAGQNYRGFAEESRRATEFLGTNLAYDALQTERHQDVPQTNARKSLVQTINKREAELRQQVEIPFTGQSGLVNTPRAGLALSGGGSKAAAVAMGALAGLSDTGLLPKLDYISSVSGGGYAAYYYYAHQARALLSPRASAFPVPDLFTDCVGMPRSSKITIDTDLKKRMVRSGICDHESVDYAEISTNDWAGHGMLPRNNRLQAFVRCKQDMLDPGRCSVESAGEDVGWQPYSLLGTVTFIPWSFLSSTLFDWGYSTAPTAKSYRDGIGMAYSGVAHRDMQFPRKQGEDRYALWYRVDCDLRSPEAPNARTVVGCDDNIFDPDPKPLTFDELRRAMLKAPNAGGHLPFWIINATATKYRSGISWFRSNAPVPLDDTFEMTAISHGSGRYGFVPASPALHDMTVLDAVAAAAAFLDSNQQAIQLPWRGGLGLAQHVLNLNWGIDIRNYNVRDDRAAVHRVLPIPFYGLDRIIFPNSLQRAENLDDAARNAYNNRERSSFIRLTDGGNGENLGLLSLVKRGVRNIVVVDAAGDSAGQMVDACLAARHLAEDRPGNDVRYFYLPALKDLEVSCQIQHDKQKGLETGNAVDKGYPVHRWTLDFPVLLGCIRKEDERRGENPCAGLGEHDSRIFFIKPAMDFQYFLDHQIREIGDGQELVKCWLPGDVEEGAGVKRQMPCEAALFVMDSFKLLGSKTDSCPKFPQHSTVTATATANSSAAIYAAYRELGRQRAAQISSLLRRFIDDDADEMANRDFLHLMRQQESQRLEAVPTQGFSLWKHHKGGCSG